MGENKKSFDVDSFREKWIKAHPDKSIYYDPNASDEETTKPISKGVSSYMSPSDSSKNMSKTSNNPQDLRKVFDANNERLKKINLQRDEGEELKI